MPSLCTDLSTLGQSLTLSYSIYISLAIINSRIVRLIGYITRFFRPLSLPTSKYCADAIVFYYNSSRSRTAGRSLHAVANNNNNNNVVRDFYSLELSSYLNSTNSYTRTPTGKAITNV
jgi:hypothetical protein